MARIITVCMPTKSIKQKGKPKVTKVLKGTKEPVKVLTQEEINEQYGNK